MLLQTNKLSSVLVAHSDYMSEFTKYKS